MLRQALLAVVVVALPHSQVVGRPLSVPPADVTGHWEAPVTGDAKTFTFSFDFVAKGEKLTGGVELSSIDKTFPITNGTIKDNKVAFTAFGKWTGELVGQELRLTRELDYGRKQQMVAHRTKAS